VTTLPPSPARTTSTLYSYLEQLAAEQAPKAATLLLGLRWSFGWPSSSLLALNEFDLPLSPTPILTALEQRGGVRIVRHAGDAEASLYDDLAAGRPAIAGVDTFYLFFRPAYRRIHSSRTAFVRRGPQEGQILVRDLWRPGSEGILTRDELNRSRYSEVPLDLEREALFAGNPIGGVWFTVEVSPPRVDDAAAWARQRLGWLYDEMAVARADERGEYGIQALQKFRAWIEARLSEPLAEEESIAVRRGASLLLRPELSSRLYLGVFLRNAAHLVGDAELQRAVETYRKKLGHLQATMDTLTKTVRVRRPEYDAFIRDQLARACENEERLLAALARYDAAAPAT
jgi:hypothetical protein